MSVEDRLVRELSDCPPLAVSQSQAATAVKLAGHYTDLYYEALPPIRRNMPIYRLRQADDSWIKAAKQVVGGEPDPVVMKRLDRMLAKLPVDYSAVASLNAARWVVHWYERERRLH